VPSAVRNRFDDLFGGDGSLHSFFEQDAKALASFSHYGNEGQLTAG